MNDGGLPRGLPSWPLITYSPEQNRCTVYGKHVSYRRFLLAIILICLVRFAYVIGALWVASLTGEFWPGVIVFTVLCVIYGFTVGHSKATFWLCLLLFPKRTRVDFTRENIIVNGKVHENMPDIRFRSSRPYLSVDKYDNMQRLLAKGENQLCAVQKVRFRRVEMIYGLKLIPVASIQDQDRADQFSVALSFAYDHVFSVPALAAVPARKATHSQQMEEEGLLE